MTRAELRAYAQLLRQMSYGQVYERYERTRERCRLQEGRVADPADMQQFVQIWKDLRRRQNPPPR